MKWFSVVIKMEIDILKHIVCILFQQDSYKYELKECLCLLKSNLGVIQIINFLSEPTCITLKLDIFSHTGRRLLYAREND